MTAPTCDIFCRVIDNHGDIGVCWRLARQLHSEYDWQVRLWIDDIDALSPLAPDTQGIEVLAWHPDFPNVAPAQIVIEAFACEVPENYLTAMAAAAHKPIWINLEYLCVEAWGPEFHCQPSPHPRLPLTKHFFVPGTLVGTGGLLCEAGLLQRRRAYIRFIQPALQVFLFCYDNPVLPHLLDIWVESPTPIHCRVAQGKANAQVAAWLQEEFIEGSTHQRGALSLTALPFVPQTDFDDLLWKSDLNFVRGEDSFARAQWAALPFVWQIYPQAENAHHAKLNAFLAAYTHQLPAAAGQSLLNFSAAWNGQMTPTQLNTAWGQLNAALPTLRRHAKDWQEELIQLRNVAENLVNFCKSLEIKPAQT